jgi:RNA polymerase sigma-70 factor (ECF subfamily)
VLLDVARAHGGKAANTVSVDWTRPPEHIEPMALQDFDPERWILFHEAVDRLPIEEREVVGLRFYHGWKQKHIAELFQVDVRTVRRRWSSAREKLQVLAGALFDDE